MSQNPALPARYLLDTNILLRHADSHAALHDTASIAVSRLLLSGALVCLTAQNIIEFWGVATRPAAKNGLGWSVSQTASELSNLQAQFIFLPDIDAIFGHWERLVRAYQVQGVQVHDTRICAVALSYQVGNILTFNAKDFRRFASEGVIAVDPATIGAPSL